MSKEGDYEPTGHKDPEKYSQRGYFGDDATVATQAEWEKNSKDRRNALEKKCRDNPDTGPCRLRYPPNGVPPEKKGQKDGK